MNKKGFAATGILYTILVLFILLFSGMLTMLYSRNNILIKIQNQVKNNVEDSAITYDVYQNGTPVYFNPVTGNLCDESDAVSTTGTKTGCMKWYIFNDNITNSYVNMILDHNTTATVAWNSEGTNTVIKEAKAALENDTSTWKKELNARLITADEIAMISSHPTFDVLTTMDWFFFDSNNQEKISTTQGSSRYSWLFDYTASCLSNGCNISDAKTDGYWTSSAGAGNEEYVWVVYKNGNLGGVLADNVNSVGIRPVITINKKIISDNIIVYDEKPILEKAKALVYNGNTCKTDGSTYNYMGGCYIKGANTSNYVWYNGFMWRIMGINSDNTVRLIMDEIVTAFAGGPAGGATSYATNTGYINDWLNKYFYNNLNSTKTLISNGAYFCSESTNGTSLSTGRTSCTSGSEVTAKIGILSLDEHLLAGSAQSYFDIKGQYIRTMTPYNNSKSWNVYDDGSVFNEDVTWATGIRPIINVSSNAVVTAGNGNSNRFYVLGENKTDNITGSLSEKVSSGEYVTLEGHTYRVVRKTTDGVKLILDDFYRDSSNTIYTMSFGTNNTFTKDSGIGQKLNGEVITWLGLSNSDKIVETTYYQGNGVTNGMQYTNDLIETNGVSSKVGLIQYSDILASQSSTLLTKNYTTSASADNTSKYWTMTKFNTGGVVYISSGGYGNETAGEYAIRPVITVKNNLNIISGTGTWNNPYKI